MCLDEISVEEIIIKKGHKTIYGKMYTPSIDKRLPAIIISHGYNSSSSDHEIEGRFFAQNGYISYAYDFCGGSTCSKSSGDTRNMTLFTEEQDLLDVYEYITSLSFINKNQIFLFGASQGGMVSAMAAEKLQNKIAGMILYYPALCIPDDWRIKFPSISSIPETVDFRGMTLGKYFFTSIHNYFTFDSIGSYQNDILIVHGDRDPIVPVSYVKKAKKTYNNVDLEFLRNEGHGFSSFGSKHALEFCKEFLLRHHGRIYENNEYTEIPERYFYEKPATAGTVVPFKYKTRNNCIEDDVLFSKTALVYLPYGYDQSDNNTEYNVLYLMHGGNDSPSYFFDADGQESACKNVIDHLIADGKMKPFIICAVSYYTDYSNDAISNCANFYLELTKDLMPIFENKYHIETSRSHRAFGGFSMGAMTTWSVFENCLDSFEYFLPISGDCWALGMQQGGLNSEMTAKYLAKKVLLQGCSSSDFKIYSGCGTNDIAELNLTPQINAMKTITDTFLYCDNFSDGNLYQCIVQDGGHDIHTVLEVLYNGLPKMFDLDYPTTKCHVRLNKRTQLAAINV
jgi:pimeloyl-ACP methyl ester carboxylesterase